MIDVSDYVNSYNGGSYTAFNLQHSYGMRFVVGSNNILMTMDATTGVAMNTSLYVDNNLSISGSLIVGMTDILSTITGLQNSFNNVYTISQTDNLLNNKQNILN